MSQCQGKISDKGNLREQGSFRLTVAADTVHIAGRSEVFHP